MNTNIKEAFSINHGFLSTRTIRSRNDWRKLRKMQDDNTIVKVKKGLYRLNEVEYDQKVEVARIIPDGVFCLFTSWQYYNLSVYNPYEFYVAIRKKQKQILPAYPPVKLYYWIDKYYLLGITEIIIDNQIVKIYDLEKSVCDAVRFRNKVGIDITSEILKNYLKRKDKNLSVLWLYSRQLRIEKAMREAVTLML
jgi:predicted transcriptional regulator of viral defense system